MLHIEFMKFCQNHWYLVRNVLDACRSITRASGRGLGPGNQDFLGPVKWHGAIRQVPLWTNCLRTIFPLPTAFYLLLLPTTCLILPDTYLQVPAVYTYIHYLLPIA